VVQLAGWEEGQAHPSGTISECIGPVGDRDVEAELVLRERDVRHFDLMKNSKICEELTAVAPLVEGEYHLPSQEERRRVDLRADRVVVSIDPPGCVDIDDAVHVRVIKEGDCCGSFRYTERHIGQLEVGIHIADVSHYVRSDGVLDAEARVRGTSVYLADRRIDMLPALLSTDVCSMRCWVDRLACSCVCMLDKDSGDLIDYMFVKAIVQNRLAMSYQEAQWLLSQASGRLKSIFDTQGVPLRIMLEAANCVSPDGAVPKADGSVLGLRRPFVEFLWLQNNRNSPVPPDLSLDAFKLDFSRIPRVSLEEIRDGLERLSFVTRKLKERRVDAGALVLEAPAVDFDVDSETGLPVAVREHGSLSTMSMIEELMLLANQCAAEFTVRKYPSLAVLRRHPPPALSSLKELSEQVQKLTGAELATGSNKELADSISMLPQKFQAVSRVLLTRCMQLAKYFASCEFTEAEYAHYGLALPLYTHFTSPIRRYADIMVHRLVSAGIGYEPLPPAQATPEQLILICNNLNHRKEQADNAGRDADKIFGCLYCIGRMLLHGDSPGGKNGPAASRMAVQTTGEVLRIRGGFITFLVRSFGTTIDYRVSKDDIVEEEQLGLGVRLKVKDGVRHLRLFDSVPVRVSFDWERAYEFQLRLEVI